MAAKKPKHSYVLFSKNEEFTVERCHYCGLKRRHGHQYGRFTPHYFINGQWVKNVPLGLCPREPHDWSGPRALPPMTAREFAERVNRVVDFAFTHMIRVLGQIHQKWKQEMGDRNQ